MIDCIKSLLAGFSETLVISEDTLADCSNQASLCTASGVDKSENNLYAVYSTEPDPNSNQAPEYSKKRQGMAWAALIAICVLILVIIYAPELASFFSTFMSATAAAILVAVLIAVLIVTVMVLVILEPDWLDIIAGKTGDAISTVTDKVSGALATLLEQLGTGMGAFFKGAFWLCVAVGAGALLYFTLRPQKEKSDVIINAQSPEGKETSYE